MLAPLIQTQPKPQRKRRPYPLWLRIELLGQQRHRCAICTGPLGLLDSHMDHIVPLALGGEDDRANLQLVHAACNLRKGARLRPENQGVMPWA